MTAALAVVSLYFLHLGFRIHLMNTERCSHGAARRSGSPVPDESNAPQGPGYNISETAGRSRSRLYLSLGGISAGLCLASSIPGKQYVLALMIAAPLYAVFYWHRLKRTSLWSSLAVIVYSFLAAATPLLFYIIFNWALYRYYEGTYLHQFFSAVRGTPAPNNLQYYVTGLWKCFFAAE